MSAALKLTPRNLSQVAGLNGFRGVAELARSFGRHRVTLYRAVAQPRRFAPTIRELNKALPRRKP